MNIQRYILLICMLAILLTNCTHNVKIDTPSPKEINQVNTHSEFRISFGSCNRHDLEQPLWDDIVSQKPDAWLWLGDIVYGDTKNMEVFKAKYDAQLEQTWYNKLKESTKIYGIWDDHDYGKNNAGKEFSKKKETRDLLFNFLDVPMENEAWTREGAYQSYIIEDQGITVKLILLDCRYFRDADSKGGEGDILGETQWAWLEAELSKNEGDIHLIGNGIQIIPEDHNYEKWSNFPKSRDRLFKLLESYKVNKPILLSGDRHISELSAVDLQNYDHPLYDITSSGLTHPWTSFPGEPNQHRIGDVINVKNYGSLIFKKTESNTLSVLYQVWANHKSLISEMELFPN